MFPGGCGAAGRPLTAAGAKADSHAPGGTVPVLF
jgi:hypothetical protein